MLDADTCYRALTARDLRFDGRFFTAVLTTGIYCRPVCPARTPRRGNVRFYPSAAAAEEGGFRPCRRCRPETSPGTPAWQGTSGTVSRGLALISQGALDSGNVETLASRLGVGSRHLRRLFLEHLGATPACVAATRRSHFARRLVDETTMSMGEIALAAGFGSIRRFNDAMRRTFGRSPTEIREERPSRTRPPSSSCLALRLPFRPPLDWDGMLAFLAKRAIPGVEHVAGGAYRRTISVASFCGEIEIRRPADGDRFVVLSVPSAAAPHLLTIVGRVRSLFDLDADPREIVTQLTRHAALRETLRMRPGIRVPGAWDGFEIAVRAVLGQQVSVRGATTLAGRLARLAGRPIARSRDGSLTRLFPTPAALAEADLRGIGVPAARGEAIRALSRAVRDGKIDLEGGAGAEETVARLTALPGIGAWTASYVAMRAIRDPDAFPAGDLGVRRALSRGGALPTARQVEDLSAAWRPWRAYAAITLWTNDQGRTNRGPRSR
jgi:AraC family transcriptional regulator of adaptative response / DNA-3-methyladenine glycosylase II